MDENLLPALAHGLGSPFLSASPVGETQELAKGSIVPSQGMFSAGCKESLPLPILPVSISAVWIRDGPEDIVPIINQKASASH